MPRCGTDVLRASLNETKGQSHMTSDCLLLAIAAVLAILPIRANARDQCVAKVVQAESLPFAPQGSWLTRAKIEVRTARGPGFTTTVQEVLPWQMVVQQGEVSSIPCENASRDRLHL